MTATIPSGDESASDAGVAPEAALAERVINAYLGRYRVHRALTFEVRAIHNEVLG